MGGGVKHRSSQVLLTSMVSAAQAQQTVSATSFMQKLGPELVAQGLTSHLVEFDHVFFWVEDWTFGKNP